MPLVVQDFRSLTLEARLGLLSAFDLEGVQIDLRPGFAPHAQPALELACNELLYIRVVLGFEIIR